MKSITLALHMATRALVKLRYTVSHTASYTHRLSRSARAREQVMISPRRIVLDTLWKLECVDHTNGHVPRNIPLKDIISWMDISDYDGWENYNVEMCGYTEKKLGEL